MKRVESGVELYKQGFSNNLLLCGGFIESKSDKSLASFMKEWALKLGVNSDDVFVEERSLDTIGNAFFLSKLLKRIVSKICY